MRTDNLDITRVLPATDLSLTITGNVINVEQMINIGIVAVYSGAAPTGTFSVQFSNSTANNIASIPSASWITDTTYDKAITASGAHVVKIVDCAFRWMRFIYTRTSGTGAITVCDLEAKGV